MRAPHLTHAAATQQLDKAITPERRALHRLTIRSSRSTDGQTSYCRYYFRAVIDGELWLLARAWREAHHMTGCTPSSALIDQMLEERGRC